MPTPTTQDAANTAGPSQLDRNSLPLNTVVTLLPTPRATDGTKGGGETGVQDMPQRGVPAPQGQDWGPYRAAVERWEAIHGPAPAPTKRGRNGRPKLNPEFASWMMGVPAGWITDVPGVTDNEALKMAGNGVVRQQAEAALRLMLNRMETAS